MAQMTFAYTALDAAGVRRSGAVDAETREAAVARLAAEGRFVLEIGPAKSAGAGAAAAPERSGSARTARRPGRTWPCSPAAWPTWRWPGCRSTGCCKWWRSSRRARS